MAWEPDQYLKFQRERFAPFEDCLRLVEKRPGLRVIDLGCGTGELTRRLADALPDSDVTGVDSSPQMLAKAAHQARAGLRFEEGAIEAVDGTWDLVFSHAAIQWVDDHARLVPRLFGLVARGGQLVVQLPSNYAHPSQTIVRELAGEAPFAAALGGYQRESSVLPLPAYAELLHASGGVELTALEKVYPHILGSADEVAEWTRGTVLLPYFERLTPSLQEAFLQRYKERLRALWPAGPVFYGFRRIVFAAKRA
jgi:trans-aconitate 2-methyltransferase